MKNAIIGFLRYVVGRGRERSTWLGVISVLSALGVALNPDAIEAIVSVGMSVAGAIAILTGDDKPSGGSAA